MSRLDLCFLPELIFKKKKNENIMFLITSAEKKINVQRMKKVKKRARKEQYVIFLTLKDSSKTFHSADYKSPNHKNDLET